MTSGDLSFPDRDVVAMHIDRVRRTLSIRTTGAWTDRALGAGALVIEGWTFLLQRRYDAQQKSWSEIPPGDEEPLKDLPDCEFGNEEIALRGFGKQSGQWVEVLVQGFRSAKYVVDDSKA